MRILYAADDTDGARAAGDFLRGLSPRPDTHLHIVTVGDGSDTEAREALLQQARASLESLSASLTTEVLDRVSNGSISDTILRCSEERETDLIVVGVSHHSLVAQLFTGNIAEAVARQAHCPVLLVRPPADGGGNAVLIGVDSSARSRDAVLWTAARFPLPPDSDLHIIAVYPAQTWATFVVPSETDPSDPALAHEVVRVQSVEDEKHRAVSWVESLAREARDAMPTAASERPITTEARQGIPSDALIHAAGESKAALMVVGAPDRHERTPLDLFRTDSVSERVLRNAPCSVLFFRNPVRSESTRTENRE